MLPDHRHTCPACRLDVTTEDDCARGEDHFALSHECPGCQAERDAWELSLSAGEYDALTKRAMDYLPPIRHGR